MATAYHHVGLGYTPSPSSPYFLFGIQHRAPYNWAGGSGGVPWTNRHPKELGVLGSDDLLESGLESVRSGAISHFPVLGKTMLHDPRYFPSASKPTAAADWPLVRPAGPEPVGLSDNEKKLGKVALIALGGWLLWRQMNRRTKAVALGIGALTNPGRRRRRARRARRNPANPVPHRYEVVASTKRRGRRRYGAIGFTTKTAATAYAEDLKKGGHKARVRKKR